MRLLLVIVLFFAVLSFAKKVKADTFLSPEFVMEQRELFIFISNSPRYPITIDKKSIDKFLACRLSDGRFLSYRITKDVFLYDVSVDIFCLNGEPVIKRNYI